MREVEPRNAVRRSGEVPSDNVVDLRPRRPQSLTKRKSVWQRHFSFSRPRSKQTARSLPASRRPAKPFIWPRLELRRVSPFACLALLVVVPVLLFSSVRPLRAWEGRLALASSRALAAFTGAGHALQSLSFDQAAAGFATARDRFGQAYAEFETVRGFIRTVLNSMPVASAKVKDGQRLLLSGQQLSDAGERLTKSLAALLKPADKQAEGFPLATRFLDQSGSLQSGIEEVQTALQGLQGVMPGHLPRQYQARFRQVQASFPTLFDHLNQAQQSLAFLREFFGEQQSHEYLFLFQNNAELRPGGGFIGSLALLHFDHGQFSILDAPGRGPFAINDFFPQQLIPPAPLQSIAPVWTLHDANWFPDFPTSAKKVAWFYEQARGFPIDGVVALTPTMIERLLAVTGPLALPKYGLVVTQDNFLRTTQDQVEVNYDKQANQPKQFIVDLIPALLDKLSSLPPDKAPGVLAALEESLTRKDLLFWMKNDSQAARLTALGWSGALPPVDGDSLLVVDANLGGGKTSRVLERQAKLEVDLNGAQSENTLQLTYRHAGDTSDRYTSAPYHGYVKMYLPPQSVLLSASGFSKPSPSAFFSPPAAATDDSDLLQIEKNPVLDESTGMRKTDEFGRTAFGNWLILQPEEERTVTIRYRSSAALQSQAGGQLYRLRLTQQPGAEALPIQVTIHRSRGFRFSSVALSKTADGGTFSDTIDRDRLYLFLLKR